MSATAATLDRWFLGPPPGPDAEAVLYCLLRPAPGPPDIWAGAGTPPQDCTSSPCSLRAGRTGSPNRPT